MDIWGKTGISDNSTRNNRRKVKRGFLLGVVNNAAIEVPFRYSIVEEARYESTFSGFPTEHLKPFLTISTHRIDLPFSMNAKVRLDSGVIMTVKNIGKVENELTGKLQEFNLELIGGAGK